MKTSLGALLLAAALGASAGGPGGTGATATHATGASSDADFSGTRIRAHVEFLADDLLEGREAGTRGYDLAARYVTAELKALGLEPAGDAGSYLQVIRFRKAELVEGQFLLRREGQQDRALPLPDEALVSPSARETRTEVSGRLVFVGYGVTAPELQHDDYDGLDARGRIAVMLHGGPPTFASEQRAHFSSAHHKLRNAADHGAVGAILIMSPATLKQYAWSRMAMSHKEASLTWLGPGGQPHTIEPRLKALATVNPDGAARLFDGAPQPLDAVFERATSASPKGFELPGSATIRATSRHAELSSPNVLARLRGTEPALAATSVVLTAHLDHAGVREGASGDVIQNGAYDNATGSAILLEVARAFAAAPTPRRSVVFAFVTAEEKGLLGSDYLARHPPASIGRIVANVNLDMPLLLTASADVVAWGAENSTLEGVVKKAVASVGLRLSPDPMPQENLFVRSDQYSFVRTGVPAVYLAPGFTASDPKVNGAELVGQFLSTHYHQPSDDLSLPMDLEAAARFARCNYLIARAIAQDPAAPAWKPGNFFGTTFGKAGTAP
jgi:hypothetical protein